MKVNELILAIKSQYRQPADKRVSIFAQGAPGIGKSDAPCQAARELTEEMGEPVRCWALQATIEDPITLSGLPARDGDSAVFLMFRDKLPSSGRGILVIDEINTAPPMVQAGLYSLFLSGKLGSYTLPQGWYVVATGNRDEDRAATQRIPMPLIGRWCRVKVEDDLAVWTRWALASQVRTEIVAFCQFRPELFNTFAKDANGASCPPDGQPYACPRTYVFASNIMESAPGALEHEMMAGVLGDGVAAELMAFVRIYRNLVSPDEILLNPDKANVPEDPAMLYAVAGALSAKATAGNFDRVLIYVNRMPAEYRVLTVKLATRRDAALCAAPGFVQWSSDHTELLS